MGPHRGTGSSERDLERRRAFQKHELVTDNLLPLLRKCLYFTCVAVAVQLVDCEEEEEEEEETFLTLHRHR